MQLVTVSFDPERDTPERMAQLRDQLKPRTRWRFLTAPGRLELRTLLGDFGQNVLEQLSKDGEPTGVLRHVLQIFLVDADRAVRNVYSSGLLDPRLLLADIRTVLLERDASVHVTLTATVRVHGGWLEGIEIAGLDDRPFAVILDVAGAEHGATVLEETIESTAPTAWKWT